MAGSLTLVIGITTGMFPGSIAFLLPSTILNVTWNRIELARNAIYNGIP